MPLDLIIRGGLVVTGDGIHHADIGVSGGKIVSMGDLTESAAEEIDAKGLHVFPGVIDTQVHFREPGMEHKEDIESGTRSAICGGVTAILEMPNTNPTTTSKEALEDKLNRARGRAWCDYGFFVGAATDNVGRLSEMETLPGTPGVKVFVGSSTGTLLVPDDDHIEAVFRATKRRTPIHSEDAYRLEERKSLIGAHPTAHEHPFLRDAECARLSTERVLRLAEKTNHPVHILHLSTKEEIPLIAEFQRDHPGLVTTEITPQHLWFAAPEAYDELGNLAQMNPPIRSHDHREALRQAFKNGFFDVIGSDHAPHTLAEKAKPYPESPSGMPGVQTLLPAMLTLALRDELADLPTLAKLMAENPARLYGIPSKGQVRLGYDADLVLIDRDDVWEFLRSDVQSKCGWSPFEGVVFHGRPLLTLLGGKVTMREGLPEGEPSGRVLTFEP